MKTKLLALLMLVFLLTSCQKEPLSKTTSATEETVKTTETKEALPNKLSQTELNAFPIATQNMTLEERRQLCVDFFAYSQSFYWTPVEDTVHKAKAASEEMVLKKGEIYQGIPYLALGQGNVYRIAEIYNEDTGELDTEEITDPLLFFNQCSAGAFWAWGRVVNSAHFGGTGGMVQKNGFLPVGKYRYQKNLSDLSEGTKTICEKNGRQTMYRSYADLLPADGIVRYGETGHVKMCAEAPTVVQTGNVIDGEKSFFTIIHQASVWSEVKAEDGRTVHAQTIPYSKMSFQEAFEEGYLPFTFAEFQGTDPVDKGFVTFSAASPLTPNRLKEASLTSNYGISDVYLELSDKDGSILKKTVVRARTIDERSLTLTAFFPTILRPFIREEVTLSIRCRLATGEILEAYHGPISPDLNQGEKS